MEEPATLEQPKVEQLSFMDKAAGVFYEPSSVFESFRVSPVKIADWLVPVLLLAIITGISAYVKLSSPAIRFQVSQQMEQRLDKMVAQGKITADQAERAKETLNSASSSSMFFGMFSAVVSVFVAFFLAAAVWLFIGNVILKGNVSYPQMMGVAGLSSWIMIVGTILAILLTVLLSRPDGGLHLGMLVQMDASSKIYSLLKSADLFTIWNLAVTSIGIGALSDKKRTLPFVWVFGTWIVLMLMMVFIFGGMFGS